MLPPHYNFHHTGLADAQSISTLLGVDDDGATARLTLAAFEGKKLYKMHRLKVKFPPLAPPHDQSHSTAETTKTANRNRKPHRPLAGRGAAKGTAHRAGAWTRNHFERVLRNLWPRSSPR